MGSLWKSQAFKIFCAGSAISIAGALLAGVGSYFVRRTLALELSVPDYGSLYSLLAFASLCAVCLELGLGQMATIALARGAESGSLTQANGFFSRLLLLRGAISFGGVLLAAALGPLLLGKPLMHTGYPVFFVLCAFLAASNFELLGKGACDGFKAFTLKNLADCAKLFLMLGFLLLATPSLGLWAPTLAFPLGSLACGIALLLALRSRGLKPSWPTRAPQPKRHGLASKGSWHWLAASTALLAAPCYLDSLALALFTDMESVALYNIALPIMQIVQSLMIFPAVMLPLASSLWLKREHESLRQMFWLSLICAGGAFLAAGLFFWHFAPQAITLLFSAKFVAAAPAATILVCAAVLGGLASFLLQILNSGGRQKETFIIAALALAVNLPANILLVRACGILGAALATALTYLVLSVISAFRVHAALSAAERSPAQKG